MNEIIAAGAIGSVITILAIVNSTRHADRARRKYVIKHSPNQQRAIQYLELLDDMPDVILTDSTYKAVFGEN